MDSFFSDPLEEGLEQLSIQQKENEKTVVKKFLLKIYDRRELFKDEKEFSPHFQHFIRERR